MYTKQMKTISVWDGIDLVRMLLRKVKDDYVIHFSLFIRSDLAGCMMQTEMDDFDLKAAVRTVFVLFCFGLFFLFFDCCRCCCCYVSSMQDGYKW